MYGDERTRSTSDRMMRATDAILAAPTAIATLTVPNPRAVMIASESSSPGIASSTSAARMMTSSTRPPAKPATRPSPAPTRIPTATATAAAERVRDAPCTTRV